MEKRKWTNIKALETEIIKMRKVGRTRQEIADTLGLEKVQIKNWISRYNREQARLAVGLPPKRRGRPKKSGYNTIEGGNIICWQVWQKSAAIGSGAIWDSRSIGTKTSSTGISMQTGQTPNGLQISPTYTQAKESSICP